MEGSTLLIFFCVYILSPCILGEVFTGYMFGQCHRQLKHPYTFLIEPTFYAVCLHSINAAGSLVCVGMKKVTFAIIHPYPFS